MRMTFGTVVITPEKADCILKMGNSITPTLYSCDLFTLSMYCWEVRFNFLQAKTFLFVYRCARNQHSTNGAELVTRNLCDPNVDIRVRLMETDGSYTWLVIFKHYRYIHKLVLMLLFGGVGVVVGDGDILVLRGTILHESCAKYSCLADVLVACNRKANCC